MKKPTLQQRIRKAAQRRAEAKALRDRSPLQEYQDMQIRQQCGGGFRVIRKQAGE